MPWAKNTPGCSPCGCVAGFNCDTLTSLPDTLYIQDSNLTGTTPVFYRPANHDWFGPVEFGNAIHCNPFAGGGGGCGVGTQFGAAGWYQLACGHPPSVAVTAQTCAGSWAPFDPGDGSLVCGSGGAFLISGNCAGTRLAASFADLSGLARAAMYTAGGISVISASPLLAVLSYTTTANHPSSWIYGSDSAVSGTLTISS